MEENDCDEIRGESQQKTQSETVLKFTHIGFVSANECFSSYSDARRNYIQHSLKALTQSRQWQSILKQHADGDCG